VTNGDAPLALEPNGHVTTLWLNRTEKRNAVSYDMWSALPEMLDEALTPELRVLVVRGRGQHFCAGAHIGVIGLGLGDAGVPGGYREANAAAKEMVDSLAFAEEIPQPLIDKWETSARESRDLAEGLAAFSERRAPDFRWRP